MCVVRSMPLVIPTRSVESAEWGAMMRFRVYLWKSLASQEPEVVQKVQAADADVRNR